MPRAILACRTLEKELNIVMQKLSCDDPVFWLEAGDHNVPQKRRRAIADALSQCAEYDTVLLVMSFCGGILQGLNSGDKTLLLPCPDDCIEILLDTLRRADTYYLTDGWLSGSRSILEEYRKSLEKYSAERTNRIFAAMLRSYRSVTYLDTGCGTESGLVRAKEAAQLLNLEFEIQRGSLSLLEKLLREEEDPSILRIPPHTTITFDMRKGMIPVTILPEKRIFYSLPGENLLSLLRRFGLSPDAPCGGHGTCGKCQVFLNGTLQKACSVAVTSPLEITLPAAEKLNVLHTPVAPDTLRKSEELTVAIDIGTTSLVCSVLDPYGNRIAARGAANSQKTFGADVVTRIQAALSGHMEKLTDMIRSDLSTLLLECCRDAEIAPEQITRVCIVGNPAMEQLFLGISPINLVEIPFHPVLRETMTLPCRDYLSVCTDATLLVVPNISGYVGGDTVGCILSTGIHKSDKVQLLVDIGTNGEMVLGNANKQVVCATAAGPALEGANIHFGMRACPGAIDHVWLENGSIQFSTIDHVPPVGICGSGLIDAVAVFLDLGKINSRGRISSGVEHSGERILPITDEIYLTQEDIRQVQLAKGAIHAGIRLMMAHMGVGFDDIQECLLAGAFGNFLNPDNACRIGLLPPELSGKIRPVGNAAAAGAEMMAREESVFRMSSRISRETESLELASMKEFPRTYAKSMGF